MSLEALQKWRAQNVEVLMMELGQLSQSLARNEEQCRVLESQIQADTILYHQEAQQGMTVETLVEWQGRFESQQCALHRVRHDLEQVTLAWHQTKARLVEANQEHTLLDRIIDQRRHAQRVEEANKEQQMTDEAGVRSYLRERTNQT